MVSIAIGVMKMDFKRFQETKNIKFHVISYRELCQRHKVNEKLNRKKETI